MNSTHISAPEPRECSPGRLILDCSSPGQLASAILCYGLEAVREVINQASAELRWGLLAMLPGAESIAESIGERKPAPGPAPGPSPHRSPSPERPSAPPRSQLEQVALALQSARGRRDLLLILDDCEPEIVQAAMGALPQSFAERLRAFAHEAGVDLPDAPAPQTSRPSMEITGLALKPLIHLSSPIGR